MILSLISRCASQTDCTIDIEHSEHSLHAHVVLDDPLPLRPGDRVSVHGSPIVVRFGDKLVLKRRATVERASWMGRQWARLAARLQLAELYEVSFTPGRLL